MAEKKKKEAQEADSNYLEKSLEAEKKIREVLDLKKKYEQSTMRLRADWKRYIDAQEGVFNGVSLPFQSKYFVPKISTAVSIMTPIVIGNFPSWRTVPQGPEDIPGSQYMEKILKFQADYELDLYNKVVSWVSQAALVGTSYMYTPWVVRKDENGKTIFDSIDLEVFSIFDIFYNPTINSVEDLEKRNLPLIMRFWSTVDDIESNPLYKDKITIDITEDLEASAGGPEGGYESSDFLNSQKFSENQYLYNDVDKVVLYYMWTTTNLTVVARGSKMHLLYDGKNPWGVIPIADFKWEVDPVPNRAHGIGIGRQGFDIQNMYNKLYNQLVDNVRNSANQMFQRRKGAQVDPKQLISRPGGFVDVNEIDKDIKQIDNRIDITPIEKLLSMTDQQFQVATANTDVVQGIAGADSASEAIILNRNTALRIDLIRKNFAKALQRLGNLVKAQDLNNIPKLKTIKIFSQAEGKFVLEEISREQFKGNYDIQVEPDESLLVNRDIFRKQLLDLYNLTAQDPQSRLKKEEVIKEIVKGGVKDVDRFFMTDQEFNTNREQMAENSIGIPGGLKGAFGSGQPGGQPQGPAINGQNLPAPENGMTDKGMMQTVNAQQGM